MVNGNTWPFLEVEQRRYRFRLLNGCQSRFSILDFNDIPGVEVWQIGATKAGSRGTGEPHHRQRQSRTAGLGGAAT